MRAGDVLNWELIKNNLDGDIKDFTSRHFDFEIHSKSGGKAKKYKPKQLELKCVGCDHFYLTEPISRSVAEKVLKELKSYLHFRLSPFATLEEVEKKEADNQRLREKYSCIECKKILLQQNEMKNLKTIDDKIAKINILYKELFLTPGSNLLKTHPELFEGPAGVLGIIDFKKYKNEFKGNPARGGWSEYYETAQWKLFTNSVKQNRGGCELCGTKTSLRIHHKSYEHFGMEMFFPEDVVCLCNTHHERVAHGK